MFKSFHQIGLFVAFLLITASAHGQLLDGKPERFTRQDSLRGALRPERTCFDVRHYALDLDLNFEKQYLDGAVKMTFDIVEPTKRMQLDLFENMELVDVLYESPGHGHSHAMAFEREGNAFFVSFPHIVQPSKNHVFYISYRGKPIVAKNAPWDGGFTWSEDDNGLPWLGVSCEGIGASLWWPNKDHLSDEPDSISVRVTYPEEITFVGNGNMVEDIFYGDGRRSTSYATSYPINNYNVTLNIGDYVHIEDEYTYPDGDKLALDYYVLSYNEAKAKEHFGQVKPMLECFDQYLGKYPFMVDGFALVETPYLGMEHQGAIAYGNDYLPGYRGSDYSMIGLDFDYIIIHETGHEWYGNSVSCKDMADLWIHEGFCTYSESMYVECLHGYDMAIDYINAKKPYIDNLEPIQGVYDVNNEGASDMYSKGSLMLNTLRHVVNDDNLWWTVIKKMVATEFYLSETDADEVIDFFERETGQSLRPTFEHYLKKSAIPTLVVDVQQKGRKRMVRYRWDNVDTEFDMPFSYKAKKRSIRIHPTSDWQTLTIKNKHWNSFRWGSDEFYVDVEYLITP